MPSITLDSAREELYKCLESTEAVQKVRIYMAFEFIFNIVMNSSFQGELSVQDALKLPVESFPSECADLKKAFDDSVKNAVSCK